ncbi:MAG: acetylornithine deacetylase [Alphaproteobacteria bacterium]|nr:acetylornithine deacetylase [Alphaproteobacteria bacterium]
MSAPPDIAPARAILERLVAFDTTSRNSNLDLIDWVEAFLMQRGVRSVRVESEDKRKSNLYAIVGPDAPGGVVLSGHTDVVPVDGQAWTSDPFIVVERDRKLFGRGVADMKSFLALALAYVDAALAAKLNAPIILAFSYDEEVGCLGAPAMIDALTALRHRPRAVIVGEPTEMTVISGHKGISTFTVCVKGKEAHSSLTHRGVSAIMEALPLMALVDTMAQDAARNAPSGSIFVPPGATMTIGKIEGGTAANILAGRCDFIWDLRSPDPKETERIAETFLQAAQRADAAMKARAPEAGIEVTRRAATPPLAPALDSEAESLARALTGDNGVRAVSYAAEAGLFQRAGLPAVLCGPGSIEQAHQPDEWIALDQLTKGALFMEKLITRMAN